MLVKTRGKYCFGDTVTLADVFLVPQVYNAVRWGVDMTLFPIISELNLELKQLEAFKKADPSCQPDAQD